jgi:Polyketide cyclase / dehydrase and lipid transport
VSPVRARAIHEATVPHPAAAVWRYFHWPNLALMQPAGFFADITYGDQQPNPGATRTILLGAGHGNGAPLREVLESSDPATVCLRYQIVDPAPMPVENYRGQVRVEPLTAASCVVEFESECTPKGMDDATWRETYAAMQHASMEFIARTLANG